MLAVTPTGTAHHPRGSGPPYGVQFEQLRRAWWRIRYAEGSERVRFIVHGDVEVETFLVATHGTRRLDCVGPWSLVQRLSDDVPVVEDQMEWYPLAKEMVIGKGSVGSLDDLIRAWWSWVGRFDTNPWDPNGIVIARRLGLSRERRAGEDRGFEILDEPELDGTDRASFEAFDRGEFERKPWEQVWNEVNQLGLRWSVPDEPAGFVA